MKKQIPQIVDEEEMEFLSGELDSRDLYIVGLLKGFNRDAMKKLSQEGYFDLEYS